MSITQKQDTAIKAKPLPPGTQLEHYKIQGVIGVGGFSVVYRALDMEHNSYVAIKEFYTINCMRRLENGLLEPYPKEHESKYRIGMQRFFDEGLTLSKTKHTNIVGVSNFFRKNNTAYLVMSYERGKDLRWFIKNTKVVPDEEFLLSVFGMVCAGLKEVHKRNFLHLDLKPSNILLRANGTPLILDMGAAYKFPQTNKLKVQTLTPGYSSPEQHKKQELSLASDLYAIGMTMRACITHKSPPTAPKRLNRDTLKPLAKTHRQHYRLGLLQAIDQASSLDPQKRPQSTDEFIELLTRTV